MTSAEMVASPDGTRIATRRFGSGPPVVIVGGALSIAEAAVPLAQAIAATGLQAVVYDRRGRGGSGDTAPSSPDREVEDLAAVVEASSGPAAVLGHSAGAALTLLAAARGVPLRHQFLSEPPLRFGADEPPPDLADRLQALVDGGRPDEAVVTFLRENVGLPAEVVERLRAADTFATQVAMAQTTVYDTRLVAEVSTPTPEMLAVDLPTTVLRGDPAVPLIVAAADRLAEAMPAAELVVVADSHDHGVDPAATAEIVRARLEGPS